MGRKRISLLGSQAKFRRSFVFIGMISPSEPTYKGWRIDPSPVVRYSKSKKVQRLCHLPFPNSLSFGYQGLREKKRRGLKTRCFSSCQSGSSSSSSMVFQLASWGHNLRGREHASARGMDGWRLGKFSFSQEVFFFPPDSCGYLD